MFPTIECPEHGKQEVTHAGPTTLTLECGGIVHDGEIIHDDKEEN